MRTSRYELDMSKGSIFKNIIRFAIPLLLATVLQRLYNTADLVVVSWFSGDNAVAAVGATTSLTELILNTFIGLSIGASVVVSRRFGARDTEGLYKAVHTSILMSIIVGIIALILGLFFSKPLLSLMGTPKGPVLDGAAIYMTIIFIAAPATLVYNFGAAILRAVGDTKRPLYILAISGAVNVVLNLVLVMGFGMGVEGVAIATAVSNYLSMFMVLYALVGADSEYRLILKELKIHKEELKEIMKIGIPAGIQGSVYSLSNTVVQSGVNSFGAAAIAGSAAAGNIDGYVYIVMNVFYQAVLTSVSQNYGAKDEKRINKSILVSLLCVIVAGLSLGIIINIFARPLLSIFVRDSKEAVDFGVIKIMVCGLPYFLCGVLEILTGTLRGLGYSSITAVNSLVGVCGFRMAWLLFVFPLYKNPYVLFSCWVVSWIVVIIMHTVSLLILKKKAMKKMYEA